VVETAIEKLNSEGYDAADADKPRLACFGTKRSACLNAAVPRRAARWIPWLDLIGDQKATLGLALTWPKWSRS
jgi:hypothetical protein